MGYLGGLVGAAFGALRHAISETLIHDKCQVPDEVHFAIANEPALSDTFKRKLASLLQSKSVIMFGALRGLAWDVEQEELQASARTQDGFRKLTRDYTVSTAESAQ